jgi:hypothetical protein
MSKLRALTFGLALGLAVAFTGCEDDAEDGVTVVAIPRPDGGTPSDGGTELTTFVRELIQNQTNDTAQPTPTEDQTFVDAEPADAFPPAFFQ